MESTYLIIEMILAAVFAVLTLALSEKFLQAGVRRWGWMLAGFLLIFFGGLIGAVFSVQSFARLFVPQVSNYAVVVRIVLHLTGFVMVFSAFFLAVHRLYRQRQKDRKRQDSLILLDTIHDTVNQSLSLIELVDLSVRELAKGTASNAGCVFIYNPNREQLVLAAHRDLPRELEKMLEKIEDEGSIFFRTLKSSRPYIVGNIGNADRTTSVFLNESSYKSLLAVPLLGRNESYGVAVLFSSVAYFFTREIVQLVSSAANILGPAVGSFRLERELREAVIGYKNLKEYDLFSDDVCGFVSHAGNAQRALSNLASYAREKMGIKSIAVYRMSEGLLKSLYTSGKEYRPPHEILEHTRKAIIEGKSLVVRTDLNGAVEKVLLIPSGNESSHRQAVIFHLSTNSPALRLDEIRRIRLLARIINLQLELEITKPDIPDNKDFPEFEVDELNDLNNVLTGILGNAQLLSGNVRRDSVENGDYIVSSLDKITDEAFQAGQLIKNLQGKLHQKSEHKIAKTEIESVLKELTSPIESEGRPLRCLKSSPSLRFTFISNRNGSVDLPADRVRRIILAVFTWLDKAWRPQKALSVKLMDTKTAVNFIISDSSLDKLIFRIDDFQFKRLREFPDLHVAELDDNTFSIEFCWLESDDQNRLLILRFPHSIGSEADTIKTDVRPRILAIDDQEVIRELLASMLEELNYPYDIYPDGFSGIQAFRQKNYGILITDLGLPDIDGWEVARQIKDIKPTTPIIVISGWGIETVRKKAPANLADFILAKPFRMEQLGELISAAEELELSPL